MDVSALGDWFREAEFVTMDSVITLRDAENLLATVEAHLLLAEDGQMRTPDEAAKKVASLGLLCLALQVTQAHNLDPWEFALQPFLRICVSAENDVEGRVEALTKAAKLPMQAQMFVRSDGLAPLGVSGNTSKGLWQTLEKALVSAVEHTDGAEHPSAARIRLYTLVADELLARNSFDKLPRFILNTLSNGPGWVSLLRLYIKYNCLRDGVDLLEKLLKAAQRQAMSLDQSSWSVLQDFPVAHVVHLRECVAHQLASGGIGVDRQVLKAIDEILSQFTSLLGDSENDAKRDYQSDYQSDARLQLSLPSTHWGAVWAF